MSIEHLLCPGTEKRNTMMEGARDRKVGFFTAVADGVSPRELRQMGATLRPDAQLGSGLTLRNLVS